MKHLEPQPAPKNEGDAVGTLLMDDIVSRMRMGKAKYGDYLRVKNGRQPLIDAYQEVLDLAFYLRQAIAEAGYSPAQTGQVFTAFSAEEMADARPGRAIDLQTVEGALPPVKTSILLEAESLVHGDRGANYGHPYEDFARTAALATILLKDRLRPEVTFLPEDVATFLICVKLSREANKPKRDNRVDIAGYCETKQMVHDVIGRGA